jgi:flagellin
LKIEVVNNADIGVDADSRKYGTYTFSFGSFGDTGLVQRGKDQNDSSSPLTFQIGEDVGMSTKLQMEDMSAKNLGISGLNVKTQEKAEGAITAIEDAFNLALQQQTSIGAMEQRLGYTADTLDTMNENLQAADSALRDADMSKEISNYMKWNILAQASQYMLAQSNQNAFQVLNLLQ